MPPAAAHTCSASAPSPAAWHPCSLSHSHTQRRWARSRPCSVPAQTPLAALVPSALPPCPGTPSLPLSSPTLWLRPEVHEARTVAPTRSASCVRQAGPGGGLSCPPRPGQTPRAEGGGLPPHPPSGHYQRRPTAPHGAQGWGRADPEARGQCRHSTCSARGVPGPARKEGQGPPRAGPRCWGRKSIR